MTMIMLFSGYNLVVLLLIDLILLSIIAIILISVGWCILFSYTYNAVAEIITGEY